MATACTLTKDQKKQFKTILDNDNKDADGLRKQLAASKTAMESAISGGKSPDDVKKAVDADSLLHAQMTQKEYKAFGELLKVLDDDQKKLGQNRVLSLMGGIFLNKNWE
jgi:succinate dehydrogenase flavin-adding protein (antitoxin of CptAB toxin-antitoxin module)